MRIVFLNFDDPLVPKRAYALPGNANTGFWPSQFDPVAAYWIEAVL